MLIVQRTVPFSECTKYPWLENINMEIECFENVPEHILCKCKYLCKRCTVFALWLCIRFTVLSELRASRLHLCIVWEQLWRRKLSGFCVPLRFFARNFFLKGHSKGSTLIVWPKRRDRQPEKKTKLKSSLPNVGNEVMFDFFRLHSQKLLSKWTREYAQCLAYHPRIKSKRSLESRYAFIWALWIHVLKANAYILRTFSEFWLAEERFFSIRFDSIRPAYFWNFLYMQAPDKHLDKKRKLFMLFTSVFDRRCCLPVLFGFSFSFSIFFFPSLLLFFDFLDDFVELKFTWMPKQLCRTILIKFKWENPCLQCSETGYSNRIAVSMLQLVESIITWYYYFVDSLAETLQLCTNTTTRNTSNTRFHLNPNYMNVFSAPVESSWKWTGHRLIVAVIA